MITAVYASILSLFYMILALVVVYYRRTDQVGLGTGESRRLLKSVRVHANFSENIPMALLLMYFYELSKPIPYALHTIGTLLVLGRLLHCIGIHKSSGTTLARLNGTGATWCVIIFLSLANLINNLQ